MVPSESAGRPDTQTCFIPSVSCARVLVRRPLLKTIEIDQDHVGGRTRRQPSPSSKPQCLGGGTGQSMDSLFDG